MPELTVERMERYLAERFGAGVRVTGIVPLGEAAATGAAKEYGYGHPVKVEFTVGGESRAAVLETTSPGPNGHEHMADRAQMLLWDFRAYNALPRHARALDVGAFDAQGNLRSVRDAQEFFSWSITSREPATSGTSRGCRRGRRFAGWTATARTRCATTSRGSTRRRVPTRGCTRAGSARWSATASASWG